MFVIKSGSHYVKELDGKPCFRSTIRIAEAARFATEAEAREWAPNVFGRSMLAAVEIVAERPTPARPLSSDADRDGWVRAEGGGRDVEEEYDIHGVN